MAETASVSALPVDPEIARKLLAAALERGGDYADLYFERRLSSSLVMEEGRIKTASRHISLGLGVRVLHGEATGYAYSEDLDFERMAAAARLAGQIARQGGTRPIGAMGVAIDAGRPERTLYPVEQAADAAPLGGKVELVKRAEIAAHAVDARIERVEVYFTDEQKEVVIATSDGRLLRDLQPMLMMNVRAIATEGEKRQSGVGGGGGRIGLEYFETTTPEDLGREAARVALAMLDARPAPAGEMEVILSAGDSGILLHEAVGHGLEADFNRKRTSNYTDQVGQPVASSLCTVVDDGTVKGSRGSINIDDEGNLPRRNVLIEDGILRGYMHDRLSVNHFRSDASGNGRRESFRHTPMPRMTNTYMLNGPHAPDEILASTRRGIYAKSFGGGQVNISNGDFVFNVTEGYLVEDGAITAPLKGVTLIGNGPDALRKVSMVGNDLKMADGRWTCGKDGQSVPVGVGMPTVKIAAITVGGTER